MTIGFGIYLNEYSLTLIHVLIYTEMEFGNGGEMLRES